MRINWETQVCGDRVVLRPFRRAFAAAVRAWMQDAELRALTSSEELSEEEQEVARRSWVDDADKLCFMVFDRDAMAPSSADPCAGLIGDVELVLMDEDAVDDYRAVAMGGAAADSAARPAGRTAEVMVMIASPSARRRGCASRALTHTLAYGAAHLGVHTLVAKISDGNDASLRLFASLGFVHARSLEWCGETHLVYGPAQAAAAPDAASDLFQRARVVYGHVEEAWTAGAED